MKRSRSRMSWFLRMVVSAVLATSAVVVPAGIANAADTATPELISFSVSATQVTPGQKVTFSYVATEGAGTLSRLLLGYSNGTLTFAGPLPLTGSVTITVPDTWRNGLQSLSWIALDDPSGNIVGYYRNGGQWWGRPERPDRPVTPCPYRPATSLSRDPPWTPQWQL